MNVLVLNCGSSSLRAAVVDHASGKRLGELRVERIGKEARSRLNAGAEQPCTGTNHEEVLATTLPTLVSSLPPETRIDAVGHRVVHGGESFREPVRIDEQVLAGIAGLSLLAPLHNPSNIAGIAAARKLLPDLVHVAVFDTAFHSTLPARAQSYALDHELAEKHGVRRYGFHGTSHGYVASLAAKHLGAKVRDLSLITCHLGNGASVCAIEYGRSIETSMGMTPLEGLVMGTRAGDVDVGALLHIARAEGLGIAELDELLNRKSGLAGMTGVNDMRDIEERAGKGDERCRQAIHVFCHRVRKYIGAYAAVLGRLDAIVFTAGIGQNSALVRHHVAHNLGILGADLDEDANRVVRVTAEAPVARISSDRSRTQLLVVATDEEHAIAQETAGIAQNRDKVGHPRAIPVAVSARHIHLRPDTVEKLFGQGYKLTPLKDLSQPGQYACEEVLDVVGPKRTLKGVRVLGPVRGADQVEVSRTDEFFLGIDAPVRDSGDVRGTPGITLVGPAGTVTLAQGVICARRHIHMAPEDAQHFEVADGDVVEVALDSAGRDLVFRDVLIRVSPKFRLEMHVDTDEANAAELVPGAEGMLEKTQGTASLVVRSTRDDRGVS